MKTVFLNKFNIIKAPVQASQLHQLVTKESWLVDSDYEGSYDRYGSSYLRALWHISRLAISSDPAHVFIVNCELSSSEPVNSIGIATVIRNQEIQHPDLGIIQGTNVDYWLSREFSDDRKMHNSVAKTLVAQSVRLDPPSSRNNTLHIFGTTVPGAADQPEGLRSVLTYEAGSPAVLTIPGNDNQPVKNGQTIQLHTATY